MTHWLAKLDRVADSRSVDLRALATLLDENPITFYRGQDLSSCDLRGQDLRDMDLTGCNLDRALIDEATKISPLFDPRYDTVPDYIQVVVSRDLNKLVLDYAEEASYSYPAWSYKALLDHGIQAHRQRRWNYYHNIILRNTYFLALVSQTSRSSLVRRRQQVYEWQQRYITKDIGLGIHESRFAWVMLVGILALKVPFADNKDYSAITPNSLIRRKATGMVKPDASLIDTK